MISSLYQDQKSGKSPSRKRQRLEQKEETHRPRTRSTSGREDPYSAIEELRKEYNNLECRKQKAMCVELTSFLFDFFCEEVILPKIPSSSIKCDWFGVVRDILHRGYMKEKLNDDEQQLAQRIEQMATPKYFTPVQWGCFLNLNVNIGQPSGHKKMNQVQLCKRVKELALEWLEDEAKDTVLSLVKAMESYLKIKA
jgi:hypothetical protein